MRDFEAENLKKKRVARLSILSNTFLVFMKLGTGLAVGSISIISEAVHSAVDLVAAALQTAVRVRRSVYDSVYLAYAVQAGAVLLTGDRKLYDAIKVGELAAHIAWIGDLAQ